jgi:protease-4
MKKSRAGLAILLILFLVAGFVAVLVAVSVFSDTEKDTSTWSQVFESGNKIGVINLEGTIISSDDMLKQLRKYRKRSSIKAILIRINSPGGTVAPAQEIYREIGKIKKKKPVVVSMQTVAASAAYYVASNTDKIVCSQGTITGSIGVIMMLPEIHKVIEKIGVNVNIIKAGKYKDLGTGVRPLSDDERNILEGFAAEIHEQFISDVAAGRKGKIDKDKLREIADGRFFSGEKAKEMGLVDSIGNFYDAVKIAADLGGIKTEPELVYPKKKWEGYLDILTESVADSVGKAVEHNRAIQVSPPTVR